MVKVVAGRYDRWWFGVAWEGKDLVATASGSTREGALGNVAHCVPKGIETCVLGQPPAFAAGVGRQE